MEKKISDPFKYASGTTHALRLDWSPDGQCIASAHAMNNGGPVAKIIDRKGWKIDKDFAGHRKAITVVVRTFLNFGCFRFTLCLDLGINILFT